mmetsp:Transcript_13524/g.9533  ORF Transcript_13524/g.9533 Transcript_13524/m.9533 type:complete len:261 (-) Transcript_13524:506-1288(-)
MLQDLFRLVVCRTEVLSVHRIHLNLRARFVLADNLNGSLIRFSNFQKRMLVIHSLLTLLTKVIIVTDCAHVADTDNRTNVAVVTDKILVNNLGLSFFLLSNTVNKHTSELVSAVFLDIDFHGVHSDLKELALEDTRAFTLLASFGSFLIHLGTVAFVANHTVRNWLLNHLSSLWLVNVVKDDFSCEVCDLIILDSRLLFFRNGIFQSIHFRLVLVNQGRSLSLLLLFFKSLSERIRVSVYSSSLWHIISLSLKLFGVDSF